MNRFHKLKSLILTLIATIASRDRDRQTEETKQQLLGQRGIHKCDNCLTSREKKTQYDVHEVVSRVIFHREWFCRLFF
jgi:hypothetical protein